MSKNNKPQLNKENNTTATKKLFTPLNQKEQQTTSGGWGWKGYA